MPRPCVTTIHPLLYPFSTLQAEQPCHIAAISHPQRHHRFMTTNLSRVRAMAWMRKQSSRRCTLSPVFTSCALRPILQSTEGAAGARMTMAMSGTMLMPWTQGVALSEQTRPSSHSTPVIICMVQQAMVLMWDVEWRSVVARHTLVMAVQMAALLGLAMAALTMLDLSVAAQTMLWQQSCGTLKCTVTAASIAQITIKKSPLKTHLQPVWLQGAMCQWGLRRVQQTSLLRLRLPRSVCGVQTLLRHSGRGRTAPLNRKECSMLARTFVCSKIELVCPALRCKAAGALRSPHLQHSRCSMQQAICIMHIPCSISSKSAVCSRQTRRSSPPGTRRRMQRCMHGAQVPISLRRSSVTLYAQMVSQQAMVQQLCHAMSHTLALPVLILCSHMCLPAWCTVRLQQLDHMCKWRRRYDTAAVHSMQHRTEVARMQMNAMKQTSLLLQRRRRCRCSAYLACLSNNPLHARHTGPCLCPVDEMLQRLMHMLVALPNAQRLHALTRDRCVLCVAVHQRMASATARAESCTRDAGGARADGVLPAEDPYSASCSDNAMSVIHSCRQWPTAAQLERSAAQQTGLTHM